MTFEDYWHKQNTMDKQFRVDVAREAYEVGLAAGRKEKDDAIAQAVRERTVNLRCLLEGGLAICRRKGKYTDWEFMEKAFRDALEEYTP